MRTDGFVRQAGFSMSRRTYAPPRPPFSSIFTHSMRPMAEWCGGYAGIRGALPRTPVKDLLGKVLDNPQNLLIGPKGGSFSTNKRLCKNRRFSFAVVRFRFGLYNGWGAGDRWSPLQNRDENCTQRLCVHCLKMCLILRPIRLFCCSTMLRLKMYFANHPQNRTGSPPIKAL